MRYVIGIDEAGRGPLAGPVAVGAVRILSNFDKGFWHGIKDSKQLTSVERDYWFKLALEAKREGDLDFAVSLVSERVIDRHGITYAIKLGVKRCLHKLGISGDEAQVFLDGGLKAPENFVHQETIIRGDEKMPVISLASVLAKVTRDNRMIKFAKKFPLFNFDIHKGYGTLLHRKAIKAYGPTDIHRRSFLKRLTDRHIM